MYLPGPAPHCLRRCTVINYGNSIVLSLFPARREALYRVTLYEASGFDQAADETRNYAFLSRAAVLLE